jgi:CRISPR-associated endonuclease Csn1
MQKENEKANDNAREEILKAGIRENPSRDDIMKYRLWKESSEICPYSGKVISLSELFSGYVEVEHIIPKSKSLDNSFANKTICLKEINAEKGNRTPFDAFSQNSERWSQMLFRVNKYLPFNKRQKFKISMKDYQESDGNDFISQQLNDTRYISREATKYLKQICPDIVNVKGQLTATLRRYWNLNHILPELTIMKDKLELDKGEKSRLDHRHHAVDAITVALTNRSTLQRLTTYKRFLKEEQEKVEVDELINEFPFPWEGIISDVKESLSNIIVSHKVKKKRSGKLHEETFYGKRKNPNGDEIKDEKNQTLYSVRKPIKSLTRKMLGQIVDKKIKDMLFHRAAELHLDIDKAKDLETLLNQEYFHRTKTGDRVPIRKVRIKVPSGNIRQIGEYNKWAEPGNNYAIVLYKNIDKGKTEGTVFTLLDSIKWFDKFNNESIIKWLQENLNYEVEFINTLKANELIYFGNSFPDDFDILDKSTYYLINDNVFRVQKMVIDCRLGFRQHTISQVSYKDSNGQELNPGWLQRNPNTIEFIKLKIDANGYLELADD